MHLYLVDLLTLSYPRAACMKRFRRMNALAKLFAEIAPCKEPELVAEAVILSVVLADTNIFYLLKSLGLQVEESRRVPRAREEKLKCSHIVACVARR